MGLGKAGFVRRSDGGKRKGGWIAGLFWMSFDLLSNQEIS